MKPVRWNLNLKSKLFLAFFCVGVMSAVITGIQSFYSAKISLEKASFNALTLAREIKKRQIEGYFKQITSQILIYAGNQSVIEATHIFTGLMSGKGSFQGSDYRQQQQYYDAIFQSFVKRFDFGDLLLIDTHSGQIVYAAFDQSQPGRSLAEEPWSKTNLGLAFQAMQNGDVRSLIRFTDFSLAGTANGEPVAFVMSPVLDKERKQIGMLALRFSVKEINRIMIGAAEWEREGLGKSGETYLVGADHKMRSDSRFIVEQPADFFMQISRLGLEDELTRQMKARRSTILLLSVDSTAAKEALAGETNTKIIHDYRDIPVLSSYTSLDIPDVKWVLLSEIDRAEAFAPVFDLRKRAIFMGLVFSLFSALLGVLLSNTIARPVDETLKQKNLALEAEICERKGLEKSLIAISEREQRRIGQDLHDSVAQHLSGISFFCKSLETKLTASASDYASSAIKIRELIEKSIAMVRDIARGLLPSGLSEGNLGHALKSYTEEIHEVYGMECVFLCNRPSVTADHFVSSNFFRIAQEAVSNAIKHGGASHIEVSLFEDDNTLILRIKDNGRGLISSPAEKAGMGRRIMEARASSVGAVFTIDNNYANKGVTVECILAKNESAT